MQTRSDAAEKVRQRGPGHVPTRDKDGADAMLEERVALVGPITDPSVLRDNEPPLLSRFRKPLVVRSLLSELLVVSDRFEPGLAQSVNGLPPPKVAVNEEGRA